MIKWTICLSLCVTVSVCAQTQIYVSPTGSDTQAGTLSAPLATLAKALTKVKTAPQQHYSRSGGQQFVHTSVARAGDHESFVDWDKGRWEPTYWQEKAAAIEAVKAAGFPYRTILKPSFLMQNVLPPRTGVVLPTLPQGKIITPLAPDTKVDWVSGQDVGRFAAEAFTQPEKFNHKELSLVGDKVTMAEVAEALSAVTGKRFDAQTASVEEVLALGFYEGVAMTYAWMNVEGYKVDPQQAAGYGIQAVSLKTFLESRKALLQETYANLA